MRDRIAVAVGRSILIAACTLLIAGGTHLFAINAFCRRHRAWDRVHEGRTTVVMDSGYGLARAGDAIYTCTTPHTTGSVVWHQDLACYCAPATISAEELGRLLNGSCVVDKTSPSRADTSGACLHAHCDEHVDP